MYDWCMGSIYIYIYIERDFCICVYSKDGLYDYCNEALEHKNVCQARIVLTIAHTNLPSTCLRKTEADLVSRS